MMKAVVLLFLAYFMFPFSVLEAQETAKAEKSDGIYSLLRRHNRLPVSDYIQEFKLLNKDVLKGGDALVVGKLYKLPTLKTTGASSEKPLPSIEKKPINSKPVTLSDAQGSKNPSLGTWDLLGSKHKNLEHRSDKLKGAAFYLVSGHGGADPGAIGSYNGKKIPEDEYAYDVTLRLAKSLREHGAKVYMIIQDKNDGIRDDMILPMDKDEVCYPSMKGVYSKHKSRLQQRTDAINLLYTKDKKKYKYHRVVCVHVDSRARKNPPIQIDAYCFHYAQSKKGKELSERIVRLFGEKYQKHQPSRGYKGSVKSSNFYLLKRSHPVATYIELGNINHPKDQQRIMQENNRQALANWLTEVMFEDYAANK